MSRIIKFRAWDGKQMIYDVQEAYDGYKDLPEDSFGLFLGKSNYCRNPMGRYNVMQFTGLHDAEGKEIWEGDLLYYDGDPCPSCGEKLYPDTSGLYEVKWDDDQLQWVAERDDENFMSPNIWKELRVRGNVYEHPELLEAS